MRLVDFGIVCIDSKVLILLIVYKHMSLSVLKQSPSLLLARAFVTRLNALYPTMEHAFEKLKKKKTFETISL